MSDCFALTSCRPARAALRGLAAIALALSAGLAAAQPIQRVLEQSQALRLQAQQPADEADARVVRIREAFERLRAQAPEAAHAELRVVEGPALAESLLGRVVVVRVDLGHLPEAELMFVLAHELGHVARHHWEAVAATYARHIPGEVVKEQTDAVAGVLGQDMRRLAHQQEFEADAWALQTLHPMGVRAEAAVNFLRRGGVRRDTPTHPDARQRAAQLLAQEAAATGAALAAFDATNRVRMAWMQDD